jgi:hypothetical protein
VHSCPACGACAAYAVLYEHLRRDDGMIVRYDYPGEGAGLRWSGYRRIGACTCDDAARLAVEHDLERGGRA